MVFSKVENAFPNPGGNDMCVLVSFCKIQWTETSIYNVNEDCFSVSIVISRSGFIQDGQLVFF